MSRIKILPRGLHFGFVYDGCVAWLDELEASETYEEEFAGQKKDGGTT